MPPASTSCDMIDTTSSGMICSLDCANAESIRPRMADATQVPATVTNSENVELSKNWWVRCGRALAEPDDDGRDRRLGGREGTEHDDLGQQIGGGRQARPPVLA